MVHCAGDAGVLGKAHPAVEVDAALVGGEDVELDHPHPGQVSLGLVDHRMHQSGADALIAPLRRQADPEIADVRRDQASELDYGRTDISMAGKGKEWDPLPGSQ